MSYPNDFENYNREKYEFSVELARRTKNVILADNDKSKKITEIEFIEYSKKVDPRGKGLSHTTIYSNDEVHEIFLSVSTHCVERSQKRKKNKRKPKKARIKSDIEETYSTYRRYELIRIIEELKEKQEKSLKRLRLITRERNELETQVKKQAEFIQSMKPKRDQ